MSNTSEVWWCWSQLIHKKSEGKREEIPREFKWKEEMKEKKKKERVHTTYLAAVMEL